MKIERSIEKHGTINIETFPQLNEVFDKVKDVFEVFASFKEDIYIIFRGYCPKDISSNLTNYTYRLLC